MNKKIFLSMIALMWSCSFCIAQTEDNLSIEKAINQMFDGMRAGDSSMVSQVFHPEMSLYSVFKNKEGKTVVKEGDIANFLNAVGTPHDEIWDERLHSMEISIDGPLAQVWTEYSFYIGEKYSHCGVNAFHLVKEDSSWRILHITDTRKRECDHVD